MPQPVCLTFLFWVEVVPTSYQGIARCQLKDNEMQIGSELIIDTSDDWIPPKAAVTTADQSAHFPALFQRNGPPTR